MWNSERYKKSRKRKQLLSSIRKKQYIRNKKTAFQKLKNEVYHYKLKNKAFLKLKSYYIYNKLKRRDDLYELISNRYYQYNRDIPYTIERWIIDK